MRTAADISNGERAVISGVDVTHPSSRRIIELGFTPGQEIELVTRSFFNDPLAFSVRGTIIAIRKREAASIKII